MKEETIEMIHSDVKTAIEKMSEVLNVKTTELWSVLVKQQLINGIKSLVWCGLTPILFFYGCKWFNVGISAPHEKGTYGFDYGIPITYELLIVLSCLMLVVSIVIFTINIDRLIDCLFNPKYQAVQEIKSLINN